MTGGFSPFLRVNGGRYFDPKTYQIEINGPQAVEALQYYADLMTRYKVVVPDAITWEFDEIVAGGQRDRYAMTITLAPYGTLINDPKQSPTAGKWAWRWRLAGIRPRTAGCRWAAGRSASRPPARTPNG